MPIDTNLNVFPYFDDFDVNNEFYQILFKPGVSVQARELNQMQTILRNQIDKFGNQIFDVGTIIDGCNFQFYPNYPYAKINDLDIIGLNVQPAAYMGLFVKNNANLQAIVVNYAQGFESTAPDLNTLYLTYRNSGNTGNLTAFSGGDTLTVFDSNTGIWAVTINNAGVGFANSDQPIFTSAVAVNVTSGTFTNGSYVTQPSTGANLQIVGIDSASLAFQGQIVLSLQPRSTDLANASANSSQWAVANNDTIRNSGNTAVGQVLTVWGFGAEADLTTDGSGRVLSFNMLNRGFGYQFLPVVTIRSPNNASGITTGSFIPQNYLQQITVSNTISSVGNSYAFSVSDGTIFQKGLFLKADAQTIVVDKYAVTPNNVTVGFTSQEQIINSNIDTSLLDNANGFKNYQAPGADRLKITPKLTLMTTPTVSTTSDFFPLVSWSEGNPYQQNHPTAYSAIGDKMAQELYETEGNFVLSRFEVTSRSPFTANFESTKVSLIINPGSAYIQGYRVFNYTNYSVDILKTTDTTITNNCFITLNYGNWIRVNEIGGVFQFSTGDTVNFYDAPKTFISGGYIGTANTTPQGNLLGTARIRSLVHENGLTGASATTYKMYLFDINLNQGVNFSQIRSVAYVNGTSPGICDIVTLLDPSSGTATAQLANSLNDDLLFDSGATTLKNANNVVYTYRTIDQTLTFANTGLLTKSIATSPGETFPYVGALSSGSMMNDLYVIPTGNNLIASANISGTANVLNSANTLLGNGTTFISDLQQGDYVYLFQNSTVFSINQVVSVANNTAAQLATNPTFNANSIGIYRCFPKYAPIPFGVRTGLSANVSANQQSLTLNLGMSLQGSVTVNTAVGVNIQRSNVTPVSKTAARDNFVKICLANNAGGTSGPWCLGVSDIFRMKRIFMGTSSGVSNTSPEVTTFFYIDHKQNEDYLDIGFLYPKPNSGLVLGSGNWLLVQFDAFQTSGTGYCITPSYTTANAATIAINDATQLINMGSAVSSWEIPECFGSRGQYWDLMNQFDFRPIAANTASTSTTSGSAPINPTYSLSFGNTADPTNDKKFPLPDSLVQYNMEQYLWRTDSVFSDQSGSISVARGIPAVINPKTPLSMTNSLRLVDMYMPPYPCLPANPSSMQNEILALGIANIKYTARRQANKTITIPSSPGTPYDTQPRGYSMADIGTLDRRIQALEYYTSLNALQSNVVSMTIPSSSNSAIDRFKFGIYVDPFDDATQQDVTNPSYSAAIQNSEMTPPYVNWVVSYGESPGVQLTYTDFQVVSQSDATIPGTFPPPLVTTANVWLLRTDHLAPNPSGAIVLTDYATAQFANVSGQATLYFYVAPTATVWVGLIDPDNFQIYQGSSLILDAYNNAQSLTSTDISFLQSAGVPAYWFSGTPLSTPLGRPAAGFVNGAGKLTWTHNPAGGSNYTIVSTRQSQYDHWIYGLQYPSAFGEQVSVSPSATPASYTGNMDVEPPTLLIALTTPTGGLIRVGGTLSNYYVQNIGTLNPDLGNPDYTSLAQNLANYQNYMVGYTSGAGINIQQNAAIATSTEIPQSFAITVYGLKPSTLHNFYVNGIEKTSRTICYSQGTGLGAALHTDKYGVLEFTYFFDGQGADQNIENSYVSPQTVSSVVGAGGTGWAAEAAASMSQPIGLGGLSMVVQGGTSSASFTLQVVADADLVLGVKNPISGGGQFSSFLSIFGAIR